MSEPMVIIERCGSELWATTLHDNDPVLWTCQLKQDHPGGHVDELSSPEIGVRSIAWTTITTKEN